jgi:hypothetical protein
MFIRCMIEAGDQGHRCFHDVAWTTYAYAEIMESLMRTYWNFQSRDK